MPRRNRVDPWGDLHAVAERGLLTGNRGCVVDATERVVRHHGSTLWIACLTEFRGWRTPLARPGRWTPLFFLDDAVALAAGHRPCGLCRRADHHAYRDAVSDAVGAPRPLSVADLNRRLVAERHRRGRGIERAADRITWTAAPGDLPTGAMIVYDDRPHLILGDHLLTFGFGGWTDAVARPRRATVTVLTPPTSVAALRHGFTPLLHPTANPNR